MISKTPVLSPRQCEAILNLGTGSKSGGGFDQLAMSELFATGMVEITAGDRRVVLTVRGQRAYRDLAGQDQLRTFEADGGRRTTWAADGQAASYRVIGVRRDGTRIVLDDALSSDRAAALQQALVGGDNFSDVHLELRCR